jgi:hypothetical protein
MEQALPGYLKHSQVHRPFSDYYRQYVGISAGTSASYLSARLTKLPSGEPAWIPADWTNRPVDYRFAFLSNLMGSVHWADDFPNESCGSLGSHNFEFACPIQGA